MLWAGTDTVSSAACPTPTAPMTGCWDMHPIHTIQAKGGRAMAPRQHGGFAAQAKRRREEYLFCNTCGAPKHPRIRSLQMAYEPEGRGVLRGCLSWITASAVSILITVVCIWALFTVLGNV